LAIKHEVDGRGMRETLEGISTWLLREPRPVPTQDEDGIMEGKAGVVEGGN